MKVVTNNHNRTSFPYRWDCKNCASVLEIEKVTDFSISSKDAVMYCPLCNSSERIPWTALSRSDTTNLRNHISNVRSQLSLTYS